MNIPDPRPERGLEGERRAREWLVEAGFEVLASRWRCRLGEIDLIAIDRGTIVFVEVRSRGSNDRGWPEETLGPRKRRRLASLAAIWLSRQPTHFRARPCRFDVVAISRDEVTGAGDLRHYPDAF